MFIGHYGPAYAIKRWRPGIPLVALFLAVQLVDVAWSVLIPLGIEKVRIVPGFTATNPLDLYYMPYTHSLVASVLWAAVGGTAYALLTVRSRTARTALAVGLAIISHWFLDLLVHRPDLPLYDNAAKVGLGLWDHRWLAFALEIAVVVGGMLWYLRGTKASSLSGRCGPWLLLAVMIGLQSLVFFGKPPETPNQAAVTAFLAYVVLAAAAAWVDRQRMPVAALTGRHPDRAP